MDVLIGGPSHRATVALRARGLWIPDLRRALFGFLIAVSGTGLVSLLAFVDPVPRASIPSSLLFLVVIAAVVVGRLLAGLAAAFLSFLALGYWFTPPLGTFTPGRSELLALLEFLLVALLVAQLLARDAQAREQLAEQNTQLRELDRMKDEFLALVSHELRTPLTSIRGYLELIADDRETVSPAQEEFLAIVDRNVERLIDLVSDLLFLMAVDADRLNLDHAEVELAELLRTAAEAIRPAADRKRIDLRLDADDPLPTVGDRVRLAQLIDNLLSNAVKFTPEQGRVEIRGQREGNAITITVSDTGIGIPADELPSLFTRFFRASSATTNAIPGTGLGLAISQAIAHGHNSKITVESTPGQGTRFQLQLNANETR